MLLLFGLQSCTSNQEIEKQNDDPKPQLEGSQMEMNIISEESILSTRNSLDSTFNAILKEYKAEKTFITNIKHSQDLWEKYMDAQMMARFPEDDQTRERSVFNLCWLGYKEQIMNDRIKELQVWLVGFEEGEVCGGSVKIK